MSPDIDGLLDVVEKAGAETDFGVSRRGSRCP